MFDVGDNRVFDWTNIDIRLERASIVVVISIWNNDTHFEEENIIDCVMRITLLCSSWVYLRLCSYKLAENDKVCFQMSWVYSFNILIITVTLS